ncbi:MAG: hypothetical protein KDK12_20020 [Rhodobacteraceae bacterium]|nr:hypothetical protein [Paracoccaceae bacterium]
MAAADIALAPAPLTLDRVPLFGAFARALLGTHGVLALVAVALLLILWAGAVVAFGLPGLYLPAVVAAPLMVAMLVLISRG